MGVLNIGVLALQTTDKLFTDFTQCCYQSWRLLSLQTKASENKYGNVCGEIKSDYIIFQNQINTPVLLEYSKILKCLLNNPVNL